MLFATVLSLLFLAISTNQQEPYTRADLEKIPSVDFCLAEASKNDVAYYLFKSNNQTTAITLTEGYSLPPEDRNFPLKILIHGYTSNVTSPWFKAFKREYFRKGPHNIIYVDWGRAANKRYLVSAANVKPVGEFIADLILSLKVPLQNVHLIGHSLGAHLAGFVGKHIYWKTESRISRITATDPAGPAFERVARESRLCHKDADFVDVIHTDMGYFGAIKPFGHVDFYVNGGRHQPGCPSRTVDENCSHAMSNFYFAESINKRNVMAKAAKLNEKDVVVVVSKPDETEFGEHTPRTARGVYHLKTNSIAPYLVQKIKQ